MSGPQTELYRFEYDLFFSMISKSSAVKQVTLARGLNNFGGNFPTDAKRPVYVILRFDVSKVSRILHVIDNAYTTLSIQIDQNCCTNNLPALISKNLTYELLQYWLTNALKSISTYSGKFRKRFRNLIN